MTTIVPAALEQFQIDPLSDKPEIAKELGQDEFMKLMMAQLKNQDPMKPMDNGEFLGQMAQFSTVTGIGDMQASLETLTETFSSNQTLQATSLVGQEVLIEDSSFELNGDSPVSGSFQLEVGSGDVKLDITDAAGNVVQQIGLGDFGAGRHSFTWDGLNNQGQRMPPGKYSASVTAQKGEGYEAVTVLSSRVIDSVEFGAGGQSTLNTVEGDVLTMADIRQIKNVDPVLSTQP